MSDATLVPPDTSTEELTPDDSTDSTAPIDSVDSTAVAETVEPGIDEPVTPPDDVVEVRRPRRRLGALWYALAFAVGALLASFVFSWTLTTGSLDFERRVPFADNFYDVQARRLFDGHWDMPLRVVSVEGYQHDGKLYMYFGPVPAFLRMPVLALTDVGNGELTRVWMVAGFAVAMTALGGLGWRIRRFARGDAPFRWVEAIAVAVGAFAIGVGSTLLYLGSGPWVYHEAILWGIAFALAAFDAILAWIQRPRWWVLGLAALFTAMAVGSRLTVALGPVVALGGLAGFVLISRVWPWVRRQVAPRVGLGPEAITFPGGLALGVASVTPIALYAWLNNTKFGTWFSVPYDHQILNRLQKNRPQILAANDNTLFRLDAIPTALNQYFRPDAIGFRSEFPWIQLPTWKPTIFDGLLYDHLDRTSSVPASMPLLLGLALVGLGVVVFARRRRERSTLAALRVPMLAAAVAVVPSLAFIFLTQRYMGDIIPLLMLGALAGFFAFVAWASRRRGWMRIPVVLASVALLALATFSALANYGMARDWQREHVPPEQIFAEDREWR